MQLSISGLMLLLLLSGNAQGDSVTQSPLEESALEGEMLSLDCQYETTHNFPYLFWYFQGPRGGPKLILRRDPSNKEGKDPQSRVTAQLDTEAKRVPLKLMDVRVSDSGMYYCALTTTGGLYKLTFGAGTFLSVKPNISDSSPSVYSLKPSAGSQAQVGPACLVTDFSPANGVKILLNKSIEGKRPATLVQSGTQWSYGVVEWSSKPNDRDFKCQAQYKQNTYFPQDGTEVVQETCTMTSVNKSFKTDEKLNTLSLIVLGLKIIFLKSIVFNLLMTLCLWIS